MRRTADAYVELTKPGITLFIGVSAAAGYITAVGGWPQPLRFATAIGATMLMSGGAAALNHVAERHGDARMRRTASRPLPSGTLTVAQATAFGWLMSGIGLILSVVLLPAPATLFLVLSHISYVYIYTPLKRRTPLCTLAGAIPGALPVLAGWSATGRPLAPAAIALTGVLFLWQIPHFLALAWLAREDYARAGCPMLGVVDPTGRLSARVSLVYATAMLICALVLAAAAQAGALYLAVAGACGVAYAAAAWSFLRRLERSTARRLFLTSLMVLPVILVALVVDIALTGRV